MFPDLQYSLFSPMVLCFVLGVIAARIRSDVELPAPIYQALTVYLLLGIGLSGGVKLSDVHAHEFIAPLFGALLMGVLIPLWSFALLRYVGSFDIVNSAALAAHYGSVSAVTFAAAVLLLESKGIPFEPFMQTLLAVLEFPSIIVSLILAKVLLQKKEGVSVPLGGVIHEVLTGKSTVLLIGGLCIGWMTGKDGFALVTPFFVDPFKGVLCLFLLQLGVEAGKRLRVVYYAGIFLPIFAVVMPVLHGFLGVYVGKVVGLSIGGSYLFGILCASASYIAAPAAVRLALPRAKSSLYLTAALGITFPFNVIVGLPLYLWFAKFCFGAEG